MCIVLGTRVRTSPFQQPYSLEHDLCSKLRQVVMQCACVIIRSYGYPGLKQYPSGVNPVFQKERRHTGLFFPADDGPVDRCSTPEPGEKRGMQIERPHPGKGEDLSWKNPEGDDDDDLALVGIELPDECRFLQRFRLQNGEMMTEGDFLDGRRRKLLPPATGLVGRGRCSVSL